MDSANCARVSCDADDVVKAADEVQEANIAGSSVEPAENDRDSHGFVKKFNDEEILDGSFDGALNVSEEQDTNRNLKTEFVVRGAGGRALARRSRSPFRLVTGEERSGDSIYPKPEPLFNRSNSKRSVRIRTPSPSQQSEENPQTEEVEFVACPHTLRVSRRSVSPDRRLARSAHSQHYEDEIVRDRPHSTAPATPSPRLDGDDIVAFRARARSPRGSHSPIRNGASIRSLDASDPDSPSDSEAPPPAAVLVET